MMKFRSVDQPLASRSRPLDEPSLGQSKPEPPVDAPQVGDVVFEIGVILAIHLAAALAVTLLLRDCISC